MIRPDPVDTPRELFQGRRPAIFDRLGAGVLVLPAADVQYRSRDGDYPYHPDRELYYATGATEPGTVAVLVGGPEPRWTLFVRERDAAAEVWSGNRLGVEGAAERFRPDECHPLGELDEKLPELLWEGDRVFFRLGRGGAIERHVAAALAKARSKGPRAGNGPRALVDPGEVLDDLRMTKDSTEVELIRRAAQITLAGHRAAAEAIAPGVGEWVVEGALEGTFRAGGATGASFESIVGSGTNACILHYVTNREVIAEDDLVLVDAGAEFGLYNGDVTRTYPARGRFDARQRDIYQLVETARAAAVATVAPGRTIKDVHDAATRCLVQGLVDLGVLTGSVDTLIEEETHKAFYPHGTSHWLGLDVHDPGDYARDGAPTVLEPGMVFTVEPGLYFGAATEASGDFAGIGVRIEDDVLVTSGGCEVLTAELPTDVEAVEAMVGARA